MKMTAQLQNIPPEFSRLIAIEGITPDKTRNEKIEASEEECALLAQRFGLRHLSGLTASINIRRVPGGMVRIEGTFSADAVQVCVVSLQDVPVHVDAKFDTYFTEGGEDMADDVGFTLGDDLEAAEIVSNGMIDMGEAVAQYLSLELDPYPRAPGVSLAAQLKETGVSGKPSPFQVLEGLKSKDRKEEA